MANGEKIIMYSGMTLKQFLPTYFSKIQRHYESSAPRNHLSQLSPQDLSRKWKSGSHKDKELSSVVMNIAPSVVSVSTFAGVRRKVDCSGLIIDWDDSNGTATVLTSAKVIRFPENSKRDNYYIVVRLPNGKILLAEEHYVDYYHNIMTLKVISDAKLKPVDLYSPPPEIVEEGIEVVALSRNFYTCSLSESSGIIHSDYPYFGCELLVSSNCVGTQVGEGGPLITRMGHVCGINFFDGHEFVHPLPTSVIRSCLAKWTSHGIVVQPWFGWTVIDIAELPHDALETIAAVPDATSAVIKQVYEGSPADNAGVRPGDLVIALDGNPISSASEYTETLSSISGDLSAYSANRTSISTREIMVVVYGNDSHDYKVFNAENLTVDDRRFCRSWPGDESDWYREPLFGSQTDFAYDIGVNNNIPSWCFECNA